MNESVAQKRRRIINALKKIEGNYSDHPYDVGGRTKYGITEATARQYGFNDVSKITTEDAYRIYEAGYWHPMKLDAVVQLSEPIAQALFDVGINYSKEKVVEWLQVTLNAANNQGQLWRDIEVDGAVGDQTLTAINAMINKRGLSTTEQTLVQGIRANQVVHYQAVSQKRPKNETFYQGWDNRVAQQTDLLMQPPVDTETGYGGSSDYNGSRPEPAPSTYTRVPADSYPPARPYDPEYEAYLAEKAERSATKSPLSSKINWAQIIGLGASWGVPLLAGLSAEQTATVALALNTAQSVLTFVFRTWFTSKPVRSFITRK